MNIDSITGISSESLSIPEIKNQQVAPQDFAGFIDRYMNDTNELITTADSKLREFAVGENGNIHDVMLAISKAKTAFELGLQVRNRLLEGYQEMMRMQI